MLVIALALTLTVCGMWMLHTAWRKKARHWPLLASGWAFIFLSLIIWWFTTNSDKGVALGLVAWVCIALIFILATALGSTRISAGPIKEKRRSKAVNGILWQHVFSGVLIGPVAGLAALASATASFSLFHAKGMEHSLNLALATFLLPMLWAVLAVIIAYQQSLWHKSLTVLMVGLPSLAYLIAY